MTLKEELSLSRKAALDEQEEQEKKKLYAFEDDEMRKMISQRIEPILRLMHEKYPLEKELPIQISFRHKNGNSYLSCIWFTPMLDVELSRSLTCSDTYFLDCQTLPQHFDVCSEFDINVQDGELDDNSEKTYIFTMILDD